MGIGVELGVGYIETFAGNGKARSTGDGKLAVKAGIPLPVHVAVDKEERYLYFAESGSDRDRKSTRLNSSHTVISYAVFCLKKKKQSAEDSQTTQHIGS